MERVGILALVIFLSTGSLVANPFADVRILTEDSPPGEILDAKGRVTGPTAEFVRELGRRLGVERDLEMLPWARAYALALSGKRIALFETSRTPEREKLFTWIGPIKRILWQFWAKKSSHFTPKNLQDVKKLGPVTVYLADSRTEYLESSGFQDLIKVPTSYQSAQLLNVGRAATWLGSDLGMKEALEAAGLSPDDFEPVYSVDSKYLYIALTKDFSPAEVKLWRDALEAAKKDGTLARYYRGTYPESLIASLSRPGDPFEAQP